MLARASASSQKISLSVRIPRSFIKSKSPPGHRKNILDPRLTSVGIAAVRGPGGLFAVQDFSQLVPELSVEEQEKKVASLLVEQGFRLSDATEGARKTCESGAGLADTSAKSMIRFEVGDLNKLPEEIERKI